jgi:hypothetical protein
MRRAFLVRGLAAFAGNRPMLLGRHRGNGTGQGWTSQVHLQFNLNHGCTSDLERLPEDQPREHPTTLDRLTESKCQLKRLHPLSRVSANAIW